MGQAYAAPLHELRRKFSTTFDPVQDICCMALLITKTKKIYGWQFIHTKVQSELSVLFVTHLLESTFFPRAPDISCKMSYLNNRSKPIEICLDIGGEVTSISCGHIIVELIKFLAYQRRQIPYTYHWIKQAVTKRKLCEEEEKPLSFQSQSHYYTVSTALDNLDLMMKSILQEMNGSLLPEEICIAFGGTPVALKEVYRLILPTMCHKPQCHSPNIASDQKIQRSIFRALVTSDLVSKVFLEALLPTNLYILVKKKSSKLGTISENFQYTSGYWIPRTAKVIIIDLNKKTSGQMTCCNDFTVFGEAINNSLGKLNIDNKENKEDDYFEIESTDENKWYQSTYVMKGFKDSFVKDSSLMNSWLD